MTKEEVLIKAKNMLYRCIIYRGDGELPISLRQEIAGEMANIDLILQDFEVEDKNKILVDCLKGAMDDYHRRLQESYKKAGGIFL